MINVLNMCSRMTVYGNWKKIIKNQRSQLHNAWECLNKELTRHSVVHHHKGRNLTVHDSKTQHRRLSVIWIASNWNCALFIARIEGKNSPGLSRKRGNPDLHDFLIIHTLKQNRQLEKLFTWTARPWRCRQHTGPLLLPSWRTPPVPVTESGHLQPERRSSPKTRKLPFELRQMSGIT